VTGSTIARSYATALFELATRTGDLELIARALTSVSSLLAANPRIREFLSSPRIEVADKKNALRAAFGDRVPPIFLNFLMVVLDKRRQGLIGQISKQYALLMDEKLGRANVDVTLAHEPDPAELAEITASLSGLTGKSVVPHVHVDPAIIGGIIVRYGDRLLDGSLRRQLISLRGRLMQASIADRNPGTLPG
jgi:F-type H+-transporting ATPase subunit delta